jgi:hypothetical protein
VAKLRGLGSPCRHRGTAAALAAASVPVTPVNQGARGGRIVDMMKNDEIALVVNTVQGARRSGQLPDPARGATDGSRPLRWRERAPRRSTSPACGSSPRYPALRGVCTEMTFRVC